MRVLAVPANISAKMLRQLLTAILSLALGIPAYAPGGATAGTYAFPEEVFQKIGQDPATLKDLGDIPGPLPVCYRVFSPPPGTTIQRGIVPGGEFGGRGGVPEVFFPEDF